MNVLQEADQITSGDRRIDYGHPADEDAKIATGWDVIFSDGVTPQKVPLAMIWLKVCRELNRRKRDNAVDIAGYARTLEMHYEERESEGD